MSENNTHSKHGARYKARRHAAEILFEAEARDIDPVEVTRTREELSHGPEPVTAPVRPYTREIIEGVAVNLDLIDFAIERELADTDWTFDRLPGVDRAVLRVATWELLFNASNVPQKTAVTQAVELVSQLSTDDSPAYVNAVLDAMWKNPESPADALARVEAEEEQRRLEAEREAEERRAEAERRAAENAAFTIEGLEADADADTVTEVADVAPEDPVPSDDAGEAEPTSPPEIGVVSGFTHTFTYSQEDEGAAGSDSPEADSDSSEPAVAGAGDKDRAAAPASESPWSAETRSSAGDSEELSVEKPEPIADTAVDETGEHTATIAADAPEPTSDAEGSDEQK
ncbi:MULTISPECIES: transcription antitermination factor NusB [Corynebacterium]|uniref:Transcription antitermination protein NusB n=1 Tax=Corynebacterium glucuronolyticum TaxID=39791 RepID=A0A7T4EE26_9CORY|nr:MULTISPECIES: transcription antitermination factor NusB [Corynebacterium]EEI26556.1 transcription antitermination factor NusB [Corynebacterium glucuronolyticum ATCC 51867]OFO48237.1 transcription antitermination factor NusB [Corynebacterium sp. HMSC073D01]QQB45664.1 transcription antitermination factor NusB [Corynebacterium glucuronolyticum]QRO83171.1 transcription antitermination factor NusB [Corynebacterium glucuronolyticum]WKD63665.1 hypothetical protein CGLUCO_07065 [Corynebacterium glu